MTKRIKEAFSKPLDHGYISAVNTFLLIGLFFGFGCQWTDLHNTQSAILTNQNADHKILQDHAKILADAHDRQVQVVAADRPIKLLRTWGIDLVDLNPACTWPCRTRTRSRRSIRLRRWRRCRSRPRPQLTFDMVATL